jgi:hypothetical protein
MASEDLKRSAAVFVADCLERLRKLPFAEISGWPDYPSPPPTPLEVPEQLRRYTFTLMKDRLPSGEVRVAIQRYRYRFLGIGDMKADGFVLAPDGATRPLSEQDIWDLT